jgi:hypothetical protein
MFSAKLLKLSIALLVITCSTLILACKPEKQELQFNKDTWQVREDMDYPYRDKMLNDLVKNHRLKGLTYLQLIDSLGKPADFIEKDDTVRYEIIVGFESDIDPTYGKNLNLALGPDSVVTSYKISEWRHE